MDDQVADKTKLKNNLMTSDKFKDEFKDWENADYVRKISEYGKQELMLKMNRKEKSYNVIKNSFASDKKLVEFPQMYKEIQYG